MASPLASSGRAVSEIITTVVPTHEVVAVYSVDRIGLMSITNTTSGDKGKTAKQPQQQQPPLPDWLVGEYGEVAAIADIVAPSMSPQPPFTSARLADRDTWGTSGDADVGAADARDYVRRNFLGRKVDVRYVAGRVAHIVRTDGETVAMSLVRRGLAVPREAIRDVAWRDALDAAMRDARKQARGCWALSPSTERLRRITAFPDAANTEASAALIPRIEHSELSVTVEEILSFDTVLVVSVHSMQAFTIRLAGVGMPRLTDSAIGRRIAPKLLQAQAQGKALLRRRLLHREVRVAVAAFEPTSRVFFGAINTAPQQQAAATTASPGRPAAAAASWDPQSSADHTAAADAAAIAPSVVKLIGLGLAAVDHVTVQVLPSAAAAELLHAECAARDARCGLWAAVGDHPLETDPFDAVVVEVPGPNHLVLRRRADSTDGSLGGLVDVALAFIGVEGDVTQQRSTGMPGTDVQFPPGWLDTRLALRQLTLGRLVRCRPFACLRGRAPWAVLDALGDQGEILFNVAAELVACVAAVRPMPISLQPLHQCQINPPVELLTAQERKTVAALSGVASPGQDSAGGQFTVGGAQKIGMKAVPGGRDDDDDDGDVPIIAALAVDQLLPGIGAAAAVTSPLAPDSAFADPFAAARARVWSDAASANDEPKPRPNQPPAAKAHEGPAVAAVPSVVDDVPATATTITFVALGSRHVLSRLVVPLFTDLAADVEGVSDDGTLLCVIPQGGVGLPIVLAGIIIPPAGTSLRAAAIAGLRENLLHRRVAVFITGLALEPIAAFAAIVACPWIANETTSPAVALASHGLGIHGRVCEVAPELADSEEAAKRVMQELGAIRTTQQAAAESANVGLWRPDSAADLAATRRGLASWNTVPPSAVDVATVGADCATCLEQLTDPRLRVRVLSFDETSHALQVAFEGDGHRPEEAFARLTKAAAAAPFIQLDLSKALTCTTAAVAEGASILADRRVTLASPEAAEAAPPCWCRATVLKLLSNGIDATPQLKGRATAKKATRPASGIASALLIKFVDFGDVAAVPVTSPSYVRVVDDTLAEPCEALVTLASTPPLVAEVRLAFINILGDGPPCPAVSHFVGRIATTGDLLHPVVEYVRDGVPHVSLYRTREAQEQGEPSLSALLLAHSTPDLLGLDWSLMDVPDLAAGVLELAQVPRGIPLMDPIPSAASRGGGRGSGGGRGGANARSVVRGGRGLPRTGVAVAGPIFSASMSEGTAPTSSPPPVAQQKQVPSNSHRRRQ